MLPYIVHFSLTQGTGGKYATIAVKSAHIHEILIAIPLPVIGAGATSIGWNLAFARRLPIIIAVPQDLLEYLLTS